MVEMADNELEFKEVEMNGDGGVYRAVMYMALHAGGWSTANYGGYKVQAGWKAWTRFCIVALMFQCTFLVGLAVTVISDLNASVAVASTPVSEKSVFHRALAICGCAVFSYNILNVMTGPLLKTNYLLYNYKSVCGVAHYNFACLIHGVDALITFGLLIFGMMFIGQSRQIQEIVLNTVALNFVLDIDEYIVKYTPQLGGIKTAEVPLPLLVPECNDVWPGYLMTLVLFCIQWIYDPYVPLIMGWLACKAVDGTLQPINSSWSFIGLDDVLISLVLVLVSILLRTLDD